MSMERLPMSKIRSIVNLFNNPSPMPVKDSNYTIDVPVMVWYCSVVMTLLMKAESLIRN